MSDRVETETKKQYKKTFRQAWKEAVIGLNITPSHRLVLLLIAEGANRDGQRALAGVDYLRTKLQIGRTAVTEALAYGRRSGWLERVSRGHVGRHNQPAAVSVYSLSFPKWFSQKAQDQERGELVPKTASWPAGDEDLTF